MKRRRFCRFATLSTVASLGSVLGFSGRSPATPHSLVSLDSSLGSLTFQQEWGVLYWMPYDNDLARFRAPILEMLARASQSTSAIVAVQSDDQDTTSMRRCMIRSGQIHDVQTDIPLSHDSSDVNTLSDYFDWAYQSLTASHWIIVVLGHGGRINEISPDTPASNPAGEWTWMRIEQFSQTLERFNQQVNSGVELLFFQNCDKATLEVIYQVRHCARYTLASQLLLGAPNYYYERFLPQLGVSVQDGNEAARAIMSSERLDMYHSLTLVNNDAIELFIAQLARVLDSILESSFEPLTPSNLLTSYYYAGEVRCDLVALLEQVIQVANRGQAELQDLVEILEFQAIAHHQTGGSFYGYNSRNMEELSGLGLYVPEQAIEIERYAHMDIYQALNLVEFYQRLLDG